MLGTMSSSRSVIRVGIADWFRDTAFTIRVLWPDALFYVATMAVMYVLTVAVLLLAVGLVGALVMLLV